MKVNLYSPRYFYSQPTKPRWFILDKQLLDLEIAASISRGAPIFSLFAVDLQQ